MLWPWPWSGQGQPLTLWKHCHVVYRILIWWSYRIYISRYWELNVQCHAMTLSFDRPRPLSNLSEPLLGTTTQCPILAILGQSVLELSHTHTHRHEWVQYRSSCAWMCNYSINVSVICKSWDWHHEYDITCLQCVLST